MNHPLSQKEFAVDIPEGGSIQDQRLSPPSRYVAHKEGILSFEQGKVDLAKLSWLTQADDPKDFIPSQGGISIWIRGLCMGGGIILILIALYMKWKEHRHSTKLLVLLFLPFAGSNISCSQHPLSENSVTIVPQVLHFGKVRPTDSPIKVFFDICNNSPRNVVITKISSGCGCTVVDVPKEPILPGSKVTVAVHINLLGQFGAFGNKILVETDLGQKISTDIQGNIVSDIWLNEQSLRCTFGCTDLLLSR